MILLLLLLAHHLFCPANSIEVVVISPLSIYFTMFLMPSPSPRIQLFQILNLPSPIITLEITATALYIVLMRILLKKVLLIFRYKQQQFHMILVLLQKISVLSVIFIWLNFLFLTLWNIIKTLALRPYPFWISTIQLMVINLSLSHATGHLILSMLFCMINSVLLLFLTIFKVPWLLNMILMMPSTMSVF